MAGDSNETYPKLRYLFSQEEADRCCTNLTKLRPFLAPQQRQFGHHCPVGFARQCRRFCLLSLSSILSFPATPPAGIVPSPELSRGQASTKQPPVDCI